MENQKSKRTTEKIRLLPSVDALLKTPTAQAIFASAGTKHLTELARTATDSLRINLLKDVAEEKFIEPTRANLLIEAEKQLSFLWQSEQNHRLRRVINATGVIIHTNLGRAPLSENARRALIENAAGYCTLEYDQANGKRGRRGAATENLLAELTGAEDALVVNNCAAAAFLVLTVLARGGEAIISRGELVEIGGDFRVPDVMEQSGAILREVGTTNRTRVSDYEKAINETTKLIVRVHPSNYRIVGFTETPSLKELAETAHRADIFLYEDAGSGALFDLRPYGLTDEPVIGESIKAGADVVTFSGDKLLGGVQSGLIVGRREVIERIRKHPLYRALRVDKLIYAALEATLEAFRRGTAFEEIPVLKMIAQTNEQLAARARNFVSKLSVKLGENKNLQAVVVLGNSVIGGGSAPTVQPMTTLLAVSSARMSETLLEKTLRLSDPPIITRILENKVLIDLRTVSEIEEIEILKILENLTSSE